MQGNHAMRTLFAIACLAAAPALATPGGDETQAFISGIYLCRTLQSAPLSVPTVVKRNAWRPATAQPGGYVREGARVFQSADKSACHVQTNAPIDPGALQTWLNYTAENEWLEKQLAWNETRARPLRGDLYRLWRWESWHKDRSIKKGLLSHEVAILPGAAQPRPGERSVTATISYRVMTAD
jgi:hypothetical protein